jgi:hypothetical protein
MDTTVHKSRAADHADRVPRYSLVERNRRWDIGRARLEPPVIGWPVSRRATNVVGHLRQK